MADGTPGSLWMESRPVPFDSARGKVCFSAVTLLQGNVLSFPDGISN